MLKIAQIYKHNNSGTYGRTGGSFVPFVFFSIGILRYVVKMYLQRPFHFCSHSSVHSETVYNLSDRIARVVLLEKIYCIIPTCILPFFRLFNAI